MRLRKGCKRCRERHTKCRVNPGATSCQTCLQSNNACHFEPQFQFRSAWDDDDDKTDASWTDDQTWVSPTAPLRYVFEDGSGMQTEPTWSPEYAIVTPPSAEQMRTPPTVAHVFSPPSPPSHRLSISRLVDAVPAPHDLGPLAYARDSFSTTTTSRRTSDRVGHLLKPDLREASLLHYYAQLLAPWCDSNDTLRTFQSEVPCRALQVPMIFYAIMALTSLHEALLTGTSRIESNMYHDKCVPLLIGALSSPGASSDVDLFVTISILRQLEELSDIEESSTHLTGANRMLSEVARFASSGGLAEAASWQTLRQLISAAIVHRHPLQISLGDYERSSIATSRESGPYANAAVLLVAKALQLKATGWKELEAGIERWYDERPLSFEPIYQADADPTNGRPWPTLPILGESQVLGVQYYHISKILVLCNKPNVSLQGFEGMRQQARMEKEVQRNLLHIIGLAVSNDRFSGSKFAACHMLSFCGYCLNTVLQREQAICFLEHVASTMAWATRKTIRLLREQWAELDTTQAF